jgi:serine protease Do
VVTDASGVESASDVTIRAGDRPLEARHVASDRRSGVAVLKVDADGLVPALLAELPSRSGAFAVTVGNAYGMKASVAIGTVSGFDRTITVSGRKYEGMLQLSAAVHPGDCGGFVADSSGRLIGLVHSAWRPDEEGESLNLLQLLGKDVGPAAGAAQVSFATPAEVVQFAADRIIKHKRMVRGWIGLALRPLAETARAQLNLEGGAEVVRVEFDSPARRARLKSGDVLLEFDGRPVRDLDALRKRIAGVEKPEKVNVVYLRAGERREAELQIENDPQR